MKFVQLILLILTLGSSSALAASPASAVIKPSRTSRVVCVAAEPLLAANVFRWLDEVLNGTHTARRVSGEAYRYNQREDRRGGGHGFLYYLALGIWRLAAAAGAAAIAGKAVEKQNMSAQIKNIVFIAPFLVGLIWPLIALFGAGIVWLACKESKTEPPAKQ